MIEQHSPLILGSASPRRREILETLGIPSVVLAANVDERQAPGEEPDAYLSRVVAAKLEAVTVMLRGDAARARDAGFAATPLAVTASAVTPAAILVADTIVIAGGAIVGKPVDRADAERMLRVLAGATHEVKTRFAVRKLAGPSSARPPIAARASREEAHLGPADRDAARGDSLEASQTVSTLVTFRRLEESEIVGYAATGEGLDKAGAYAVQGIGSFAVERIEGSYSNVVGLPACELVLMLGRLGLLGRFPR